MKNMSEMKLLDYIKSLRKKVSFYGLFNALDKLDEQSILLKHQKVIMMQMMNE